MNFTDYFTEMACTGYHQMEEQSYHAFPALSSSILKMRTQAEMLHQKLKPESETTEALTFGSLLHAAALEPWKFAELDKHFVIFTERKGITTKAADACREANPGRLVVTPDMIEHAANLLGYIKASDHASRLLNLRIASPDAMKEATLIGYDTDFNVRRRIRVDYLPRKKDPYTGRMLYGDYLLDVKTTAFHVGDFESQAWKFGYYKQAAYYLDTHEKFTGHRPKHFVWLVISKTAPAMARVYTMENMTATHPLYEKSKLQIARRQLGLDAGGVGSIAMFCEAARGHVMDIGDRVASELELRTVWQGYEHEEPYILL